MGLVARQHLCKNNAKGRVFWRVNIKRFFLSFFILFLSFPALSFEVELFAGHESSLFINFDKKDKEYKAFVLSDPERIVVDVVGDTTLENLSIQGKDRTKTITNVRYGLRPEGELRLVFDVSDSYKVRSFDWVEEENAVKMLIEAYPKDSCTPNAIEHNICDTAKKLSQEIAKGLPLQLNKNLVFEKVVPVDNVILLSAFFTYSKKHLESVSAQTGLTTAEMESYMRTHTQATACGKSVGVKPFIELGGEMHYHYRFSDGMEYLMIKVTDCKQSG